MSGRNINLNGGPVFIQKVSLAIALMSIISLANPSFKIPSADKLPVLIERDLTCDI